MGEHDMDSDLRSYRGNSGLDYLEIPFPPWDSGIYQLDASRKRPNKTKNCGAIAGRSSPFLGSFQRLARPGQNCWNPRIAKPGSRVCPKIPGCMEEGPGFPLWSHLEEIGLSPMNVFRPLSINLHLFFLLCLGKFFLKTTFCLYWSISKKELK